VTGPREAHLDEGDFFLLVLPPGGSPEVLPAHLSACAACSRRFAEWRAAVEGLAVPEDAAPPDFDARVMEKVRSIRAPRRGVLRNSAVRIWAARLSAAACLLAAFWLGTRVGKAPSSSPPAVPAAGMTETDRADDELLRDVARQVSSEDDANWRSVAPLPPLPEGNS